MESLAVLALLEEERILHGLRGPAAILDGCWLEKELGLKPGRRKDETTPLLRNTLGSSEQCPVIKLKEYELKQLVNRQNGMD